jgi:hypothetical protein
MNGPFFDSLGIGDAFSVLSYSSCLAVGAASAIEPLQQGRLYAI